MKKFMYLILAAPSVFYADQAQMVDQEHPLHFSVGAAFTYWQAKQDGMDVAQSAILGDSGTTYLAPVTESFEQSFGYKPGFKVGLGMGSDLWNLDAIYTYYRGTNTVSEAAPENTSAVPGTGVWNMNSWFLQEKLLVGSSLVGTNLSSTWKIGMDLGDLVLSRPFGVGHLFSCSPFGGLRTFWIRQTMDVALTQAAASFSSSSLIPSQPLYSYNNSHAWAIGPRLGALGACNMGLGLRLDFLFAASLLYTKFTSIEHQEQRQETTIPNEEYGMKDLNYNTVRPTLDMGIGFGYGKSFDGGYGFDVAARYDFSYFFGQNQMRSMLDKTWGGVASGDNDLYFQGLTIHAMFTF